MKKLSPEIIQEILRHVYSKTDLCNIRLVQRSFSILAKELLFKVIPIYPSKCGLSGLVEISHRPELASQVKKVKLVFNKSNGELHMWPEFTKQLTLEGIDPAIEDETNRAKAIRILRACIDKWYRSQETILYTSTLATAFARLPRLKEIVIVSMAGYPNCISGGRDELKECRILPPALTKSMILQWEGSADLTRAFIGLVNAVYLSRLKITSFVNDAFVNHEIGIDCAIFAKPEYTTHTGAALRNCRIIKLCFRALKTSMILAGTVKFIPFNAFSTATGLEVLDIRLSHETYEPDLFPLIFGVDHVWLNLKKISFESIDVRYADLFRFLQRHKNTLRSAHLHRLRLHGGSLGDLQRLMLYDLRLELACIEGYNTRAPNLRKEIIVCQNLIKASRI